MPSDSKNSASHLIKAKAEKFCIPVHAQIELTHRCNLSCKHCYLTPMKPVATDELSLSEITNIFDQLAAMGTIFLTLTGGEIMLREDIIDIISAANKRNFVVTLLTNGTLIDHQKAQKIFALNPLQVHISLLGTEAVHDSITGSNGSFAKAIEAMDAFRAFGVKVVCKSVVTSPALTVVSQMRDIAKAHADSTRMTLEVLPFVNGDSNTDELSVRECDFACLPEPGKGYDLSPSAPEPDDPPCSAGRSLMAISPYGEVMPCISFRMVIGNSREKSLREIWASSCLDKLRAMRNRDVVGCNGCEDAAYCNFCPGLAYNKDGNFFGPVDEICARARRSKVLWQAMYAKD
ncbi:MAG: radical SAM protein [Planctomycetes bacterium]|nr:radical SAM protein [Planctomycetota bacterium]